jgi:pyridoxal phosphate enzyme (YggS family)
MSTIRENVAAVKAEIAAACRRAGRDPAVVRLIAVTKEQEPPVLAELVAAGVTDFGENRIEHLERMRASAPAGTQFHAIGRVQGRQLAAVVAQAGCLHSLCDDSHLARLERLCADAGKRLPVFIQVNTSGEAAKAGLAPDAVGRFVTLARAARHLDPVGLMTMAPELASGHADVDAVRRCFARLAGLARSHDLSRLSMGMSQDFVIAVEEGATDVRVGTRLFA